MSNPDHRPWTILPQTTVDVRNRTIVHTIWRKTTNEAISERLSSELPGLRGFSPTNIRNMRIFHEQWSQKGIHQLPTDELSECLLDDAVPAIRQLSTDELSDENPSIGLLLCHSMDRPVVELAVRRYSMPLGVATYRTSEDMPPAYKALKPLLDGSQKLLAEMNAEAAAKPKSKGKRGAK